MVYFICLWSILYFRCDCILDGENLNTGPAYLSNNGEYVDITEKVMIFVISTRYVEVMKRVREVLKIMELSEEVELEGRYDVWLGPRTRMKIVPIT